MHLVQLRAGVHLREHLRGPVRRPSLHERVHHGVREHLPLNAGTGTGTGTSTSTSTGTAACRCAAASCCIGRRHGVGGAVELAPATDHELDNGRVAQELHAAQQRAQERAALPRGKQRPADSERLLVAELEIARVGQLVGRRGHRVKRRVELVVGLVETERLARVHLQKKQAASSK